MQSAERRGSKFTLRAFRIAERKQAELETIARDNADRNLQTARERYNNDRAESQVVAGDLIFLKRQARVD